MTKAELIEALKDWSADTIICIGTPHPQGGVNWNDVDHTYGMKAGPLKDGTPFLKQDEFYLWPTKGRV